MKTPLILEIKGNSLDDGPGIRSVVFFKGCPLSCAWCHNPESQRPEPELAFDPVRCVACDTCLTICPEQALSRDNHFFVDRNDCTLCMACTEVCPAGALERVGRAMTVAEIVTTVVKDKPFFDTSGGGVTLSGGEPTLFPDFTAALLAALKDEGIHTIIETCGMFRPAIFLDRLAPRIDTVYFDIKLMDPAAHMQFCGTANTVILDNFRAMRQWHVEGGPAVMPRIPLVPGITDTRENLQAIADFLVDCGAKETTLLPYHPLWREKTVKIGRPNALWDADDRADRFMTPQEVDACRAVFHEAGIKA